MECYCDNDTRKREFPVDFFSLFFLSLFYSQHKQSRHPHTNIRFNIRHRHLPRQIQTPTILNPLQKPTTTPPTSNTTTHSQKISPRQKQTWFTTTPPPIHPTTLLTTLQTPNSPHTSSHHRRSDPVPHHCTQHPILTPRETTHLINLVIDWAKQIDFDLDQRGGLDWDVITAKFNAKFKKCKRQRAKRSMLVCAFAGLKKPFWDAFFAALNESRKARRALEEKYDAL